MKKSFFVAGTLLALTPLAAVLPGCGGGGDGIVTPTATVTAGPTATASGTATAGPTPTLVPTSTSAPLNVKYNLTLVPSSDSNFLTVPTIEARLNLNAISTNKTLQLTAEGSEGANSVEIRGNFSDAAQGKVYTTSSQESPITIVNRSSGDAIRVFQLQSGTITITTLTSTEATLTFRNAIFSKQENVGNATGTVRVNGTVSGPFSLNSSV